MKTEDTIVRTPEEAIETIKSNMPISGYQMLRESLNMAIEALKEVQYYLGIGTVEECREAVEKQKQKRPIKILVDPFEYDYDYICPNCRRDLNDPKLEAYCRWCGQAIQWYE